MKIKETTQVGVAVFTLAAVFTPILAYALLTGAQVSFNSNDLPLVVRPIAYLLFALCLWSGFQVFDRLLPHVLRLDCSWGTKIVWLLVVFLLMPIGPAVYYLAVYRIKAQDTTELRSTLRGDMPTFAKRTGIGFLLLLTSAVAEFFRTRGASSTIVVLFFLVQMFLALAALIFIVWGICGMFHADAKGLSKLFSKDATSRR